MRCVAAVALLSVLLVVAWADGPSNQTASPPASNPPPSGASQPAKTDAVPLPARDSSGVPAEFRDLWKQAASG